MADQPPLEAKKNASFDKKDANSRNAEPKDLQELTRHVHELLLHMQEKCAMLTEQLLGRIDDMSHRIEEMDKSINDIVGLEAGTPTGSGGSIPGSQQTSTHGKEGATTTTTTTTETQRDDNQ